MSTLLKKVVLSFLSALVFLFSIAPYLSVQAAASTWYDQSPSDFFSKVYDPTNPSEIFGERYTAAQVQWVIYSILTFPITATLGTKGMVAITCLTNIATGRIDVNSCISSLTANAPPINQYAKQVIPAPVSQNLWALVFADRPMSGISYVKEKFQNFSLVPVAHAQVVGFGFNALLPIQSMWSAMRDIAFSFFVIVAVVFAFLIMFRVKMSPQTVITVQSAIPKIVMAIITVTFSYAIAGFLIDFMYVVIGLLSVAASRIFSATLGPVAGVTVGLGAPQYFNFLTLGQPFGFNVQLGAFGLIGLYLVWFFVAFIILLAVNIGALGIALNVAIGAAIAFFAEPLGIFLIILVLIIAIIAIVAALWHAVRILWTLVKAFVNVILLTIFAPIQLTLGVLVPNFGFGAWVKSYLSALSTFVVTGALLLFSYIFLFEGVAISLSSLQSQYNANLGTLLGPIFAFFSVASTNLPLNPFNGAQNGWPPLVGVGNGGWTGFLLLCVSFVLFTIIPRSAELVQSFIQGKPFAYGNAIGEAVAPYNAAWNLGPTRLAREQMSGSTLAGWLDNSTVDYWGQRAFGPSRFQRFKTAAQEHYPPPSGRNIPPPVDLGNS